MENITQPKIGDVNNYQWPKSKKVFGPDSTGELLKAIVENNRWSVTEKMDGAQMTVSSMGWISSSSHVIADKDSNLDTIWLKGSMLKNMLKVVNNVKSLKKKCFGDLDDATFQYLLFGKCVLHGTSTSCHDVYGYRSRGLEPGTFLADGMGIVFNDSLLETLFDLTDCCPFMERVKSQCGQKTFFILPINELMKNTFESHDIDCVNTYPSMPFNDVMTHDGFQHALNFRHRAGFVLNHQTCMLEWASPDMEPRCEASLKQLERMFDVHDVMEQASVKSLREIFTFNSNYINTFDMDKAEEEYKKFADFYELKDEWASFINTNTLDYNQCKFEDIFVKRIASKLTNGEQRRLDPRVKKELRHFVSNKFNEEISQAYSCGNQECAQM
jgi:hypothetical protein